MTIQYEVLDPRPAFLVQALELIQEWKDSGKTVVGFEVTVPQQAEALDLNIDPQHTGGNAEQSCILECLTNAKLPSAQAYVFCTNRADLDSLGGMALLGMINPLHFSDPTIIHAVQIVHEADIFAHGEWNPRPLFSQGYEQSVLGAIARAVADFKVPLKDRVQLMADWLVGNNPHQYTYEEMIAIENGEISPKIHPLGIYQDLYEKDRKEILQALESGETKVEVSNGIATVQSTLRAATSIGYAQAPVVVALNPTMPSKNGSYKKFTVCQYSAGYCDLSAVLSELRSLEPGWGGSPAIIGSPQQEDSILDIEQVLVIVQKHTTRRECNCGSGYHWANCPGIDGDTSFCG